jgi:cytoskeletal protein CcmA (bactofilin family)
MSSKSTRPDQPTRPDGTQPSRGVPSIISPDLRITGDLVCAGDIQIDGWIEGNVTGRHIHLGENAMVSGSLMGELVRISGTVSGEVRADNVVLEKTARVTGDILHKSLAIEQGAFLEGRCKRIEAAAGQTSPDKPATAFAATSGSNSVSGLIAADAV